MQKGYFENCRGPLYYASCGKNKTYTHTVRIAAPVLKQSTEQHVFSIPSPGFFHSVPKCSKK